LQLAIVLGKHTVMAGLVPAIHVFRAATF
jgi:hypothetical protein